MCGMRVASPRKTSIRTIQKISIGKSVRNRLNFSNFKCRSEPAIAVSKWPHVRNARGVAEENQHQDDTENQHREKRQEQAQLLEFQVQIGTSNSRFKMASCAECAWRRRGKPASGRYRKSASGKASGTGSTSRISSA